MVILSLTQMLWTDKTHNIIIIIIVLFCHVIVQAWPLFSPPPTGPTHPIRRRIALVMMVSKAGDWQLDLHAAVGTIMSIYSIVHQVQRSHREVVSTLWRNTY